MLNMRQTSIQPPKHLPGRPCPASSERAPAPHAGPLAGPAPAAGSKTRKVSMGYSEGSVRTSKLSDLRNDWHASPLALTCSTASTTVPSVFSMSNTLTCNEYKAKMTLMKQQMDGAEC